MKAVKNSDGTVKIDTTETISEIDAARKLEVIKAELVQIDLRKAELEALRAGLEGMSLPSLTKVITPK